jgi:hypothetical protein
VNNSNKDFTVIVTKPDGTTKELFYSTIVSTLIERNDTAKAVSQLFECCDNIKKGVEVNGELINMKGYTFKRKNP